MLSTKDKMAAALQKFCLKWNNFQNSVTSVFENLRQDEELVDITLCCEGQKIKAHRMMLSACSPYFRDLLKENPCQHPVFFLKDTSYPDLAAVVEFVYKGEVNVLQSQLGSFLKTAEMLQVKGLSGDDDDDVLPGRPHPVSAGAEPPPQRHNSSQPMAASPRTRPREPPEHRPASPRYKRRRLSADSPSPLPPISGAQAGPPPPPPPAAPIDLEPPALAATPVSSASQLESALDARPLLLPAPPPPPSPAGPPLAPHHSGHMHGGAAALPPPQHHHHHGDDGYNIKVEKVDITDGDDDVSLEETLGHVSNMEAGQFEGSDHSTSSHDMAGLLSRLSEQGGSGDMSMAGTAGTSEDGSSQGVQREPLLEHYISTGRSAGDDLVDAPPRRAARPHVSALRQDVPAEDVSDAPQRPPPRRDGLPALSEGVLTQGQHDGAHEDGAQRGGGAGGGGGGAGPGGARRTAAAAAAGARARLSAAVTSLAHLGDVTGPPR